MTKTGSYTVNGRSAVLYARVHRWTPEQLIETFPAMSLDVARDLLEHRADLDERGTITYHEEPTHD